MIFPNISGIFGISPGVNFPRELANGILSRFASSEPEVLANLQVIVNSTRMRHRLTEELIELGAMLHPRILTLAEVSQLIPNSYKPNPSFSLVHKFELMALVQKLVEAQPDIAAQSSIYALTKSLSDLIDEMQGESVPVEKILNLDISDLSGHWKRSQLFLNIIKKYLENRQTDPDKEAWLRNIILSLKSFWAENPPKNPILIAGSSGSRATTRQLIQAIIKLPNGAVVLPGFDFTLPSELWGQKEHIGVPEDHPQYRNLKTFFALGLPQEKLKKWYLKETSNIPLQNLIGLSLRPAPVTDCWLSEGPKLGDVSEITKKMALVEADSIRDESLAIAFRMVSAIKEEKSLILVSPNRKLTRMVSAYLSTWDIVPDDSAGVPLQLTPSGRFLRLVISLFTGPVTATKFFALLKHPLTHSCEDFRTDHLEFVQSLELFFRTADVSIFSTENISIWLKEAKNPYAAKWANWICDILNKCKFQGSPNFEKILDKHIGIANALASGPGQNENNNSGGLWKQNNGRHCLKIIEKIKEASPTASSITASRYADVFNSILAEEHVPEINPTHPNLMIWGTLEARAHNAEVLILAGMNEGSWPAPAVIDPWLNRKMRKEAGLLSPERRIGLSAHDYQQSVCSPNVLITRSTKDNEAETVPSRWLNRLLNLLGGLSENSGPKAVEEMRGRGTKWLDWANETKEVSLKKPAKRPSPKPPKDTRPKRLSVTEIKTLIRDPYAIYAKHILKLKPLRPLHESADPLLRGIIIHKIFEQFVENWQQDFSELDQKNLLLDLTRKQLAEKVASPTAQLFWFSRVEKIADWFVSEEENRRNLCKPIALEKKGKIVIPSLGFDLTAQVDRVDINQNGEAVIYDYKTGAVPNKNVQLHFDKQLFLLSLIVENGGFSDIAPLSVANASFIDLSNKKAVLAPFDQESLETHRRKFHLLIERYLNPDQGFTARRAMFRIEDNSDYDGISRFGEWSITDEVQ